MNHDLWVHYTCPEWVGLPEAQFNKAGSVISNLVPVPTRSWIFIRHLPYAWNIVHVFPIQLQPELAASPDSGIDAASAARQLLIVYEFQATILPSLWNPQSKLFFQT
jgi:hypothetical protein